MRQFLITLDIVDPDEAARRFSAAPVARLATVGPDSTPHLVPVVFAVVGPPSAAVIYTAVDGKPKRTVALRRLANIAANPAVTLLVDHYDHDWSQLWWVRADGDAEVHHGDAAATSALAELAAKYPQYQTVSLDGPVIAVRVRRWSGWKATEQRDI